MTFNLPNKDVRNDIELCVGLSLSTSQSHIPYFFSKVLHVGCINRPSEGENSTSLVRQFSLTVRGWTDTQIFSFVSLQLDKTFRTLSTRQTEFVV